MSEEKKTRRQRGDIQLRGDIKVITGILEITMKIGFLGGLLVAVLGTIAFYPGGLVAFLLQMGTAVTHGLLGIPLSPKSLDLLRAWHSSEQIRTSLLILWIASTIGSGYGIHRLMRWRGEKGASGRGLRAGEERLMSPSELAREISRRVDAHARNPHDLRIPNQKYTPHDLVLSGSKIRITDKTLSTSMGIAGASGTGKTTVINEMLKQILAAGDKAMVVDINGEFYSRFGRPGDIIISLTDTRTAAWDFWAENMEATQLAAGLVEYRDDMDAASKFFQGNALSLLAAMIRQSSTLPEMWQLTMRSLSELRDFLTDRKDPAKSILDGREGREATAIFNIATHGLKTFLPYLGHHVRQREMDSDKKIEPFSIRQWVLDDSDQRFVFLVSRDQDWAISKPLFQLASHIATFAIVERSTDSETRVWYVCDEIAAVGLVPSLPMIPDRGRKYYGRAVVGFQTYSQLQEIFGVRGAARIAAGFGNMLVFKVRDPDLAKVYSMAFTEQELEWTRITQTLSGSGSGPNLGTDVQTRPLVTASQFMNLPERTAYARFSDFPPTRLEWPAHTYAAINPDARTTSELPRSPWLGSIEVTRYRAARDQERARFLDEMKAAVDGFLVVFHHEDCADRKKLLLESVSRCKRILGEASTIKESFDGEIFEISISNNHLVVVRSSTKVTLPLQSMGAGSEEKPVTRNRPVDTLE